LLWPINRVVKLDGPLILFSALLFLSLRSTANSAAPQAVLLASEVPVYASADEGSQSVGVLLPGENLTPLAETQGSDGIKWYLVKTKGGVVGWIKQSDNDQAKKVDTFFKSLPQESAATAFNIPNVSSAAAPHGAIIVPVLSAGRATIVSATFNQAVSGNLMLDTGATSTVISRRLASLLSLRPIGNAAAQTVGGVVQVSVAKLRSLKVGEAEATDLTVIIHDFSRDPRFEGLLGMDFLGRYRMGLDVPRQVLVLLPR
jgi:aspartyl protease/SH3 domain-containing protein